MSLTGEIEKKSSPTRRWMDERIQDKATKDFVKEVNDQLVKMTPIIVPGSDAGLVGMAFDYAFRWKLGPMDKQCAASIGAKNLRHTMESAESVFFETITIGDTTTDPRVRAQCCIVLTWFEQAYRSPRYIFLKPELAQAQILSAPYTDMTVQKMLDLTPNSSVEDILALVDTIEEVWGDDLTRSFILNPSFVSSHLVGAADADWIMDYTLYDCKCSWTKRPLGREEILQLLGYALLDSDDVYGIQTAGWYFARQRIRLVYPLSELFERIFGTADVVALRQSFKQALCQVRKESLLSRATLYQNKPDNLLWVAQQLQTYQFLDEAVSIYEQIIALLIEQGKAASGDDKKHAYTKAAETCLAIRSIRQEQNQEAAFDAYYHSLSKTHRTLRSFKTILQQLVQGN